MSEPPTTDAARPRPPPKLGLEEMMTKKSELKKTGIDKTHLGCISVSTSKDGTNNTIISYEQTKLPQEEQDSLAKIYDDWNGNLDIVASKVPPEYGISIVLLKQNPPLNSKEFAIQCVEGAYHFDESSGTSSDKAALVSRLPPPVK